MNNARKKTLRKNHARKTATTARKAPKTPSKGSSNPVILANRYNGYFAR